VLKAIASLEGYKIGKYEMSLNMLRKGVKFDFEAFFKGILEISLIGEPYCSIRPRLLWTTDLLLDKKKGAY
jgi:hypothetical protein